MEQRANHIEQAAYRVSEFCQRYVISKSSFYREVQAGRLRLFKRGRTTLVARVEAERWFKSLTLGQPQPSPLAHSVGLMNSHQ